MSECHDVTDTCMNLYANDPNVCAAHSTYMSQLCPVTCGQCSPSSCSIEAPTSEALVVGSDATITQVRCDTQIRGASGAEVAFVPHTLIGPEFGPSCHACIFFLPVGSTSAIGTSKDENRELKDYFPPSLGALKL